MPADKNCLSPLRVLLPVLLGLVQTPRAESPSGPLALERPEVRVAVPASPSNCLDSASLGDVATRLPRVLDSSGAFLVRPDAASLVRLTVDTSDGQCAASLSYQDTVGREDAHLRLPPGKVFDPTEMIRRLVSSLGQSYQAHRGSGLEVRTDTAGMEVALGGLPLGRTPLALQGIRPGRYQVVVSGPGWMAVVDSVDLRPGMGERRQVAMLRTAAWLDSVRSFRAKVRHDSVLARGRSTKAGTLSELFSRLTPADLPPGRHAIAVVPFSVSGPTSSDWNPGTMAAEYGVVHFAQDGRFVVVEREGVNRLLKEQALVLSGAVVDSGAVRSGMLLSARYLVTGHVSSAGQRQVFSARMVSVESGEIVGASVAEVAVDGLEQVYRDALGERAQFSAAFYRSAVAPGWGQFYTGHPVQGGLALGANLLAAGWAAWCLWDYSQADDRLATFRNHSPSTVVVGESFEDWVARAEGARTERNDAAMRLGWSLGIMAVAWLGNVADASWLGYRESRRIRARYFAISPRLQAVPDGLAITWGF